LGGDDAHSVDLGNGRILWLFGDSLIDVNVNGRRSRAMIIRNSIGIQTGDHPSTAGMRFFWRQTDKGEPASFFPESGTVWFWPADGIRVGNRLLLFLTEIKSADNALGFDLIGWRAVVIDNPDDLPVHWRVDRVQRGAPKFEIIPGTGGVLLRNRFVYAYGCDFSGRRAYLVRWSQLDAGNGDLRGSQWWCGQQLGWLTANDITRKPAVLFDDAQVEFGVYHDRREDRYLQFQTIGFGAADLGFRTAVRPEGPWGKLRPFYRPPEKTIPGVLIYAAKVHDFTNGGLPMITYLTNLTDISRLDDFPAVYYPQVLRVTW
jgi:hypothetical protein